MEQGYEYRANLPRVLELAHRKSALHLLGSLGITMAENATWAEMYAVHDEIETDQSLMVVEYDGLVPVDGIFGKNSWRLNSSQPTEQSLARYDDSDQDVMLTQAEIFIHHRKDVARVLLIPDSPPVTLYDDDLWYVVTRDRGLWQLVNDAVVVEAVRKAFGPDAVEYLSESAAKSLANALLHDNPHSAIR
jgi:hypothetical protein